MQLTQNQQKLLEEIDFVVGDLVKLMSGGPIMTVLNVGLMDGDKVIVTCGFFNPNFAYLVNPFPPEALRHYDDK